MISRYSRAEMMKVWTPENKFSKLLEVEIAVAQAQASLRIIPRTSAANIAKKARFKVQEIDEIEKTTRHDVIAFVTNVASYVGEDGKYLHFGMTSSDVLDTAQSLILRQAFEVLETSLVKLEKSLSAKVKKHRSTLCAGRTHGIHAEPTTFGLKLAGHLAELTRVRARIELARDHSQIAKLSGPVGTYSTQPQEVEKKVAKALALKPETVATQVVPRDRHAEVIVALSFLGSMLERLATEIRHLQRTEVGEVEEGFTAGQKGSSAMPHKKNPIGSENITGLARLLRSYVVPAFENIALWHERDISHSSVERVIFADAFLVADYATDRMAQIIRDLVVNEDRMKSNLNLTQGQIFSSKALLALVEKGLSREDAYKIVQGLSHTLKKNESLEHKLTTDAATKKLLRASEVKQIFSGKNINSKELIDRVLEEAQG